MTELMLAVAGLLTAAAVWTGIWLTRQTGGRRSGTGFRLPGRRVAGRPESGSGRWEPGSGHWEPGPGSRAPRGGWPSSDEWPSRSGLSRRGFLRRGLLGRWRSDRGLPSAALLGPDPGDRGPAVVARADPMEARLCAAEAGITAHLLAGRLSVGVYHQAMAALAAEDARRRPFVIPPRRR
jgi:hypothetical protein